MIICDASDEAAIERFRDTLRRLGAQVADKDWAIGVDICRLTIGDEQLSVFGDGWTIRIDGSDD